MLKVNPIAIFCYMFMTIFITMFTMHPIMLAISLFSSYVLYLTLGGVQKAVKSFSYILPIIVISAVFNGIFVHKGASILFYVGNTAITLEAIINGLATGTMFASVIYWFNCVNILLTSDKIVYIFSKYAPKIGTILMISLGLCPKYTKQFKKIDENLRALGLYEDAGIIKKIKLKIHILSTLITWSIENSLTLSDSMSARGYEMHGKRVFLQYSFKTADMLLVVISLVLGIGILTALGLGYCSYYFYPKLKVIKFDAQSVIFLITFLFMNMFTSLVLIERLKWRLSVAKI